MTEEKIRDMLEKVAAEADEEKYPDICDILGYYRDEKGSFYAADAAELADELFQCDETKMLPPAAAKLVEEIYREQIAEGNCAAANDLGSLYYTGRIGVKNYAKAMRYYEFAAKGGDRQAQENLGYCYYYGRSCEKDYEKAFHYFALGAFDGHLRSLYKIGDMYRNGYYVEKNEQEAFYIYQRCLDDMTDAAIPLVGADVMMRLGDCYAEGIGCAADEERALRFYQESERLFYKRLKEGDFLIRRCYEKVIARQDAVRKRMTAKLPRDIFAK